MKQGRAHSLSSVLFPDHRLLSFPDQVYHVWVRDFARATPPGLESRCKRSKFTNGTCLAASDAASKRSTWSAFNVRALIFKKTRSTAKIWW